MNTEGVVIGVVQLDRVEETSNAGLQQEMLMCAHNVARQLEENRWCVHTAWLFFSNADSETVVYLVD